MNIIKLLISWIVMILYFIFVFPILCFWHLPENIRYSREQLKKAHREKKEVEESRKHLAETIERIQLAMNQTCKPELDIICIAYDKALTEYIGNTLDGTKSRVREADSRMRAILQQHGDALRTYLKPFEPILHLKTCPHGLKNYHFRTAYGVLEKKE